MIAPMTPQQQAQIAQAERRVRQAVLQRFIAQQELDDARAKLETLRLIASGAFDNDAPLPDVGYYGVQRCQALELRRPWQWVTA